MESLYKPVSTPSFKVIDYTKSCIMMKLSSASEMHKFWDNIFEVDIEEMIARHLRVLHHNDSID